MTFLMWTILVSGLLLFTFSFLFKVEEARGKRFLLSKFRGWLDAKVAGWQVHFHDVSLRFGGGSLRVFFHFILHQLLGAILFIIRKVESGIHKLRVHNKVIAHFAVNHEKEGHLRNIARHKEEMALSKEEKEYRKHRSLEG